MHTHILPPLIGVVSTSPLETVAMVTFSSVFSSVLFLFGFFCITLTQSACVHEEFHNDNAIFVC